MSRPPTSSAELRRVKMLIDAFAANPDAAEFHEIDVDASPDVV